IGEPEEPDGAGTGVGADHGAERRHEPELRMWPRPPYQLPQRLGAIGRVRVGDRDAQPRPVARARLEGRDELLEGAPVAADALDRNHLAAAAGWGARRRIRSPNSPAAARALSTVPESVPAMWSE